MSEHSEKYFYVLYCSLLEYIFKDLVLIVAVMAAMS